MTENKKNKGGRPATELTPEQIKEVELLSSYLTIRAIADYFGMSEKTFRNLKKRDEEVLTSYNRWVARARVSTGNT